MALFLCLMALSAIGMAQVPAHLKGPAAKNYKSWTDKSTQADTKVLVSVNKPPLTGPAAKNQAPYRQSQPAYYQIVSTETSDRKLTGPPAKNRNSLLRSQLMSEDVVKDENKLYKGQEEKPMGDQ